MMSLTIFSNGQSLIPLLLTITSLFTVYKLLLCDMAYEINNLNPQSNIVYESIKVETKALWND